MNEKQKTIQTAFEAFHVDNPHIYNKLVSMARTMKGNGRKRLGLGMFFEVLRWDFYTTTTSLTEKFKLNNNFRSRYARRIVDNEPDLSDVFQLRALKSL